MKRTFARAPLVLSLATAALVAAACGKSAPPPPPAPEVQIATVQQRDLPIYIENIGQTLGSTEVEVRARVEGFLETIEFREGSYVKKGDLLYTIDPRNLEQKVAEASGQAARAQADLARARQDVARYAPLVKLNAIPRQQYDTAVAMERAAEGAANAADAAAKNSQIDLQYAKVYAPLDGLVGKTEVKPGNLVGRGDNTLLTTISNVDPIHVRVTIAEQDYLKYARAAREKTGAGDRFELVLADGSVHPQRGDLVFSDRLIDPTTGTLLIETTFPNPDKIVRPGQYARVRVAIDTMKGAILVPQRAVKELQATYTVAVVSGDNVVSMRTVKPGERVGSLWAIASGLAPGEKIVVEGLQKVRDGMTVKPTVVTIEDPGAAPKPAAAAAPAAGAAPAAEPAAKH